jgi:hypothetical protein
MGPNTAQPVPADKMLRRVNLVRLLCRAGAVLLGALHSASAATYQMMNPDGIAYLDIADRYVQGDFRSAVNAVWSPMYSWALSPVVAMSSGSTTIEFSLVHLANLVIYLVALTAFEFFWRQVSAAAHGRSIPDGSFPPWAWTLYGYLLFVWVSLELISISAVTPDLLMSALLYVAAGLVARIRVVGASASAFAMLGMVLGLAYLSKSVMFPLSLVIIAIAVAPIKSAPMRAVRTALALAMFAATAGPFVALISEAKGRFTFGEAGHLTYLKVMNGVPYAHWQGYPGEMPLKHPSRRILDVPPIYEFGSPVPGTYPIGYDPSYWYEGAVARFSFSVQREALLQNVAFYARLFLVNQLAPLFTVLVLYLVATRSAASGSPFFESWGFALIAGAALLLYALVLVEGRYVGAFLLLLWADLLSRVRLPSAARARTVAVIVMTAAMVTLAWPVARSSLNVTRVLLLYWQASEPTRQVLLPVWPDQVAAALRQSGVSAGDEVAVIGYAFESYWARLARVRIVAEMFGWEASPFWRDPGTRERALTAFAGAGAKAVIAEQVQADLVPEGWRRVGSSHFVLLLAAAHHGDGSRVRQLK